MDKGNWIKKEGKRNKTERGKKYKKIKNRQRGEEEMFKEIEYKWEMK